MFFEIFQVGNFLPVRLLPTRAYNVIRILLSTFKEYKATLKALPQKLIFMLAIAKAVEELHQE